MNIKKVQILFSIQKRAQKILIESILNKVLLHDFVFFVYYFFISSICKVLLDLKP